MTTTATQETSEASETSEKTSTLTVKTTETIHQEFKGACSILGLKMHQSVNDHMVNVIRTAQETGFRTGRAIQSANAAQSVQAG